MGRMAPPKAADAMSDSSHADTLIIDSDDDVSDVHTEGSDWVSADPYM